MSNYIQFLEQKRRSVQLSGFNPGSMNDKMFPFQKFIVEKSLSRGRSGIFADCGLGKTFMQLEWAKQVSEYTNKPVLITCPLAVGGQTIKEAEKFGYGSIISKYGKDNAIQIINYEQLDNVNCSIFSGIVLDESSILKNYEGAYRNLIIENFNRTPYKLACTATPAPNDPMELGNHSEFLNIMGRSEMLAMYYVHDGGETAKWRLKKHSIDSYYKWVGQWATMLTSPADIGFDASGYDLPSLNYIEQRIITPQREGKLFNDVAISATNFNQELRLTREKRLGRTAEIVNGSDESFIVWIKQNEEGELLRKMIPGSIEVKGSDSNEYKEEMLLGFADNKFRVLITKTKIAQFGLNYQNCHNQVFASPDFSFESLYQAVRRSYRFGQSHPVNIYILVTDTMQNVIQSLTRKQKQFEQMQHIMSKSITA